MDLSSLERFRAIVRHGSMTAAAQALGCTQPTLSAMVRRLEEHYGSTLLLRTSRGVQPTATGQALTAHIDALLAHVDRIEQHVVGLEHGDVGRFVVGCNDSLGAYFLPVFLPRFAEAFPRVDIELWTGPSADVRQAVIDRTVQFGLVVNPPPHPDLVMVQLFRDAVDLMAARAADDEDEAHARIEDGPLLMVERMPQAKAYRAWFDQVGLRPTRWMTCGELELVKAIVAGGFGIGILPRRVASYGGSGLVRLWTGVPAMPDRIELLYRADLHRTRAAMHLKDALVRYGKGLDADYDAGSSPDSAAARLRRPPR